MGAIQSSSALIVPRGELIMRLIHERRAREPGKSPPDI